MLKILDRTFAPLCVLTKTVSMQWTKRFYDVGSFELCLVPTDENLQYIKKDYYISHDGNYGIIRYLEQGIDNQNNPFVKVCGYDLKGLLKYRKCEGEKTGNTETIIKGYVSENLITATDANRRISNFINADIPTPPRGINTAWKCDSELSKLDVEVNKLCLLSSLGYDVTLVDGIFIFDVMQGVNKTKSQTDIPSVMFCKQFKNISDFDYVYDDLAGFNTVYVGTTEIYNTAYTGIDRKEGIDTSTGTTDEVLARGQALLKENAAKENISAETNYRLNYKTDWNNGDYVTLKVEVFGETLLLDKQVTEVLEVYERGNVTVKPTFGEVKESAIKRIMRG